MDIPPFYAARVNSQSRSAFRQVNDKPLSEDLSIVAILEDLVLLRYG